MSQDADIQTRIEEIAALLRAKMGASGATLARALPKARHRMPRTVYRQARMLADAAPLAGNPKLRLTLDGAALTAAADAVEQHLNAIDLADQRRGWWLGMLGGLVFNLLSLVALLLAVMLWRGYI